MHIRFSTCIGTNIVCDSLHEAVGQILEILINPDSGKVEGFFVVAPHVPFSAMPFVSALDIVRWGTAVHIRDADMISPAGDRIRLQPLLDDRRRILGQRIRTESGKYLGRCKDVQFNTDSMRCEWLFPRKWMRWSAPIPFSNIVEVRGDAIIVRDELQTIKDAVEESEPLDLLEAVTEMPKARSSK